CEQHPGTERAGGSGRRRGGFRAARCAGGAPHFGGAGAGALSGDDGFDSTAAGTVTSRSAHGWSPGFNGLLLQYVRNVLRSRENRRFVCSLPLTVTFTGRSRLRSRSLK